MRLRRGRTFPSRAREQAVHGGGLVGFSSLEAPVDVRSVHLGMTHHAVLKARSAQVVKRRWSLAQVVQLRGGGVGCRWDRGSRWIVGVALEAHEADLVASQHTRVG